MVLDQDCKPLGLYDEFFLLSDEELKLKMDANSEVSLCAALNDAYDVYSPKNYEASCGTNSFRLKPKANSDLPPNLGYLNAEVELDRDGNFKQIIFDKSPGDSRKRKIEFDKDKISSVQTQRTPSSAYRSARSSQDEQAREEYQYILPFISQVASICASSDNVDRGSCQEWNLCSRSKTNTGSSRGRR